MQAPFGTWKSPITSEAIATGSITLQHTTLTPEGLFWLESRPSEGGRYVVVRRSADGTTEDAIPAGWNARTRVHEYGGGSYWIHGDTLFFTNFADQRLYRVDPGSEPRPITPEPEIPSGLRYADGVVTGDGGTIICVRERHHEGAEATNELVALAADGSGNARIIASGHDFYSSPRLSPDGKKLAFLAWDHPHMPWDGTELHVGDWIGGRLERAERVQGGGEDSIFQPAWSPDGVLHFVSDRSGWWNLYRLGASGPEPIAAMEAEFGVPQWVFGLSTYAFLPDGRIIAMFIQDGVDNLALIEQGKVARIDLPFTAESPATISVSEFEVAFIGGSPDVSLSVILLDARTGEWESVQTSSELKFDRGYLSAAQPISFPTEGGQVAHALFYPPKNKDIEGAGGEKPPLIVFTHGGPTSRVNAALNLQIQFWTSRGFAVVDVNYGGSTGYGTEYRNRLRGNWGVVDIDDCVNAARYLVRKGEVDENRLVIRGGSAGGYTTLGALAFRDVFRAGANYFGVADMETFVGDTHKFESRYLDTLIGPYPESKDLYYSRSPVNFADQITAPLITFQGLEDLIVPPSQSEQIVEALRKRGIRHEYLTFEGEQHGFRKAETIKRVLDAELSFYTEVL